MTEPADLPTEKKTTESNARGVDADEVLAEIGRAATALAADLGLDETQSELIGQEVEFAITRSGLRVLTPGLVRELTMAVLAERGVSDAALRTRARIGLSVADAERIIRGENQLATVRRSLDPSFSDRALSSSIKREYALQSIFSEPVVAAHLAGDIHVEDLGEPDRLFSLTQPYEFPRAAENDGAGRVGGREIERAIARLAAETRSLALHLSGEIVWDAFNWKCAALFGHDSERLTEYAESVIDSLASALSGTGCPKVVLHLDWNSPAHLPGFGHDEEKTSAAPARTVMNALLATAQHTGTKRDEDHSPVRFVVHLRTGWESNHDYHQTLEALTHAASAGAGVRLSFDREDQDALFVRYGLAAPRRGPAAPPRAFCFSRISINFARLALASGKTSAAEKEKAVKLKRCVELAAQAHLEKRIFLEKLLALGNRGPLARLAEREVGQPFLKLDRAIHLISPVGLSEANRLAGGGLDEARDALGHLQSEVERLSAQHKIRLLVAPSRSRQAPLRFARLDGRREPSAKNSPPRSYRADLTIEHRENKSDHFARVEEDAQLHAKSMYEAEVRLNVRGADPKHLAVLISRALYQTSAAALCFQRE